MASGDLIGLFLSPKAICKEFVAILAACVVGACGSGSDTAANGQETGTGIPPLPPAETAANRNANSLAASLSMAGHAAPAGNPYEHAMGCAVALNVLAVALDDMPALAGEAERSALQRARMVYDRRMAAEARRRVLTDEAVKSEMDTRREQALDDPMPEVRRAAACLRELTST